MPAVMRTPDVLQRIAALEQQVAMLQRTGRTQAEVPFFPTSYHGLIYEDNTTFSTLFETVLTPRASSLALGMVLLGDQVGATNTGGQWQLVLDDFTVVASGNVPATFSFQFPTAAVDLTPYRAAAQVKVQLQTRRTAGATTGGRYGGGGAIGAGFRWARLI